MIIEPSTTINILKDCPLDNTYCNTIFFDSVSEQSAYFHSLTVHTITDSSYQRVSSGVMRVNISADRLYHCNYLMFQNSGYYLKWFYAFITGVEYINDVTSDIRYEIDVMQTWFFDYAFTGCYVDREHTATDVIGENTYPENFETGDYIVTSQTDVDSLKKFKIAVATTVGETTADDGSTEIGNVHAAMYGGLFSGVTFELFDNTPDGAAACADFLEKITDANKSDAIVSVFLVPEIFAYTAGSNVDSQTKIYTFDMKKPYTSIDGYVPRNKKMFTSPYNVMYITNNMGSNAVFKYEDFFTDKMSFKMIGDMSQNPSVYLIPKSYKIRKTDTTDTDVISELYNFDEKMTLTGFPLLPYNVDMYKAWAAQNLNVWSMQTDYMQSSAIIGGVQNLGGAVFSGAMSGGGLGALVSGAGSAWNSGFNMIDTYQQIQIRNAELQAKTTMPRQAKNTGHSTSLCVFDKMTFTIQYKQIKREYARMLDQFWDMYGYPCHRIKTPNRNVRPHWTYTKTVYCNIRGNVPSDDNAKICAIYNKGITFWRQGGNIGNYGLDNTV